MPTIAAGAKPESLPSLPRPLATPLPSPEPSPEPSNATSHARRMDGVYRLQRHIYDVTRKYFLFGRDRLIDRLDARAGMHLLEVGCGTGRNLALAARRWPGLRLAGLDISQLMLRTARRRLAGESRLVHNRMVRPVLVLGDATDFSARQFGNLAGAADAGSAQAGFDRIMLSYTLSMIPHWQAALACAIDALAENGQLHVVDFGTLGALPAPVRWLLLGWLSRFHVSPRADLGRVAKTLAHERGCTAQVETGPLAYFTLVRITRPG